MKAVNLIPKTDISTTVFWNKPIRFIKELINKALDNRFIRNTGWIVIMEFVNRVSRLLTAIVLARYLSPIEFGVAAIALTSNEFIKVFTQNGIGAKIIQANEEDLEAICNTAYRLNWIVCSSLFVIQCCLAYPIAQFYDYPQLTSLIISLAFVYLMMPIALVQIFLIQRQNRLKVTAILSGAQVTTDNIITALFAILGFGVWSIVLPKLLVAPIWVFGALSQYKWKPEFNITIKHYAEVFSYGKNILGAEISKVARLNADNLLIGYFLGLEALGIYYFAKNAGLGISLSLITAFNMSFFAHLCSFQKHKERLQLEFVKSIKIIVFVLTPIILLQSFLAEWYVPIIFGEKWDVAIPVLILLCLSAIPRPFGEAASCTLRVIDRTDIDFKWQIFFSLLFVIVIFTGLPWGIEGVATGILLLQLLHPFFAKWVFTKFVRL